MKINTDINILGGLPDFEIIGNFVEKEISEQFTNLPTKIKTEKSVKRFEKAIKSTLLTFSGENQKDVVEMQLVNEGITDDSKLMLFWNASYNNDLLDTINSNIFFPAYFSGRVVLKQEEISAFLNELKKTESELQKWADSTIEITSSKYLTLLKKFNLLEGGANKKIKYPFLSDKMFTLFIYWVMTANEQQNILKNRWLKYSFSETEFFIERVLQKKFSKFFEINYSGDKLQINPLIDYKNIYDAVTKS